MGDYFCDYAEQNAIRRAMNSNIASIRTGLLVRQVEPETPELTQLFEKQGIQIR